MYPYHTDAHYPETAAQIAASLVRDNVDFTCCRMNTDGAVVIRFLSADFRGLSRATGYQVYETISGRPMI